MKKGSTPYSLTGSPEPGTGIRILEPEEIMKHLQRPSFRNAVDKVERGAFDGRVSGVKVLAQRVCSALPPSYDF